MKASLVRLFLVTSLVVSAVPAFAGPVPSKTAADQTIAARSADVSLVQNFAAREDVAQALVSQGFSKDQVQTKISALSDQDLHNLAQNLNEIQAAGMSHMQWTWTWIGIGALAALILVTAL